MNWLGGRIELYQAHALEAPDLKESPIELATYILGESGAGHTQVFIDDDHLFFGLTQLASFLSQSILPSSGFRGINEGCSGSQADVIVDWIGEQIIGTLWYAKIPSTVFNAM